MITANFEAYGVVTEKAQQRIGFYLADTFGMMPFVSALEPLRAANRFSGQPLYSWHLYGSQAGQVQANNALRIDVHGSLSDASDLDRIIVCGPHEPHLFDDEQFFRQLRRLAAAGTRMGAVDTGTYLLAKAGLVREQRCTIHWENLPGFSEDFPQLSVSSELFEIDGNLFTCAGGDASMDMMLTIIEQDHGRELAARATELFVHSGIRSANEQQRLGTAQRTGIYHKGLVDVLELMEANIEQPLSAQELADMVGISKRQLERLFKNHLQTTPTHHYQQIRLRAGMKLLQQTSLSVLDIALSCGFSSAGHFSKRFRVFFGQSPRDVRAAITRG